VRQARKKGGGWRPWTTGSKDQGTKGPKDGAAFGRGLRDYGKTGLKDSRAERTVDGPKANRLERSDSRAAGSPAGEINIKDHGTKRPKDQGTKGPKDEELKYRKTETPKHWTTGPWDDRTTGPKDEILKHRKTGQPSGSEPSANKIAPGQTGRRGDQLIRD